MNIYSDNAQMHKNELTMSEPLARICVDMLDKSRHAMQQQNLWNLHDMIKQFNCL